LGGEKEEEEGGNSWKAKFYQVALHTLSIPLQVMAGFYHLPKLGLVGSNLGSNMRWR